MLRKISPLAGTYGREAALIHQLLRWSRVSAVLALLVLASSAEGRPSPTVVRPVASESVSDSGSDEACGDSLGRRDLEASLRMGLDYLAVQQNEAGDFVYEYDWVNRRVLPGNNLVRQAGATWALALGYARDRSPRVERALRRALTFFDRISLTRPSGARFFRLAHTDKGGLGAVALVALSEIDYLRAGGLSAEEAASHRQSLDGYVQFLLEAQTAEGLFCAKYTGEAGQPFGPPSPYADGEALLALARMARHLGRQDLRDTLVRTAAATYARHVRDAAAEGDSDEIKGFYQWGTMAYFELLETGWEPFRPYAETILDLADWMIDVHAIRDHRHNTAYALEGLIPAMVVARERGDRAREEKLACAARGTLQELSTWQVGGPVADAFIDRQVEPEARAIGGVQNGPDDPVLRVDVTQHQMHAVMMALDYAKLAAP
jgi:hypothetical protein